MDNEQKVRLPSLWRFEISWTGSIGRAGGCLLQENPLLLEARDTVRAGGLPRAKGCLWCMREIKGNNFIISFRADILSVCSRYSFLADTDVTPNKCFLNA